jgi:hypothetical protein
MDPNSDPGSLYIFSGSWFQIWISSFCLRILVWIQDLGLDPLIILADLRSGLKFSEKSVDPDMFIVILFVLLQLLFFFVIIF